MKAEPDLELVLVRATVKLPGVKPGQLLRVDPSVQYIADALRATHLVPVPVPDAEEAL